nr:DUF4232 domain-containing protein [Kibdelosporangium phytohabitans]
MLILTALLALTACGRPQPLPMPPPPSTTTPTPDLTIRLGTVDGAMGLRTLGIQLTNETTTPTQINGYPDIRVLDDTFHPLPLTIGHGTNGVATIDDFDTPPQPITLHPGDTVHAALLWRNLVTQTDRKATLGTYLDIAPTPGAKRHITQPQGGIDLGNTTTLGVSAWAKPTP